MMMNIMKVRWVLAEDGVALSRWLGCQIAIELVSSCGRDGTQNPGRPKDQEEEIRSAKTALRDLLVALTSVIKLYPAKTSGD